MSKIAVLLPKEYMLEQARKVIQEKKCGYRYIESNKNIRFCI